jgi:hypothetical protein
MNEKHEKIIPYVKNALRKKIMNIK